MSKKTLSISVGCFVFGLLVGVGGTYLFAMAYWGKQVADALGVFKQTELAGLGQKAFETYQHDSQPVAIYALGQYLAGC